MKRAIILSVLFLIPVLLFSGETVQIRSVDLGGMKWNLDEKILGAHRSLIPDLREAMKHMDGILENPIVASPVTIWTVSSADSLKVVSEKGMEPVLMGKLENGVVRDSSQVAFLVPPGVSSITLERFLLGEYARILMGAKSPRFSASKNPWFYQGCSAVLGWTMPDILKGISEKESLDLLVDYYRFHVDPDHLTPLSSMDTWTRWEELRAGEPDRVQADAVVACSRLVHLKGRGVISTILTRIESGESFASAFSQATGMTEEELEQDLIKEVYPAIKKSYRQEG